MNVDNMIDSLELMTNALEKMAEDNRFSINENSNILEQYCWEMHKLKNDLKTIKSYGVKDVV